MSQTRARNRTRRVSAYQTRATTCGEVTVTKDGVEDPTEGISNTTLGAIAIGGAGLAGLALALGGDRRR